MASWGQQVLTKLCLSYTDSKRWNIILFNKIILVNTCWLFSTLGEVVKSFLLSRNFLEILKNQHFYDFITSPRVEKSQQALTKIIFVEKYDISAFWIRIERNSRILQTQSTISSRFASFFLAKYEWKIKEISFIKFLGTGNICWQNENFANGYIWVRSL